MDLMVFLETLMGRYGIFLLVVLKYPASWEYVKSFLILTFNVAVMSEVSETLPPCCCRTYIALWS